jgi:hypothetical protein
MSLGRWAHRLVESNRRSRKAVRTTVANRTMFGIVVDPSPRLTVSGFGAYQEGNWFSSIQISNEERLSVEGALLCTQNPPNHFS